jgi:hypothetical protein
LPLFAPFVNIGIKIGNDETMNLYLLTAFLWLMGWPLWVEGQAMVLPSTYKGERQPAFEKIYVTQSQLIHMPDGLYYENQGQQVQVNTLLYDAKGMYILRIYYQCPLCGHVYLDKMPEGEEGCPIYEREILPGIWSKR